MIYSENIKNYTPVPTSLLSDRIVSKDALVGIKELLDDKFMQASPLTVALGRDSSGEAVYCDIAKTNHLLIGGQTGSGKSVCLHSMIMSILCKASPDEVRLILIDTKYVEFSCYNSIPHLIMPVVTDSDKALAALEWAIKETQERSSLLASKGVRDIDEYNKLSNKDNSMQKMPYIVIMADEFIDMFWSHKEEVETAIARLAAISRVVGVFMVMATQQPPVSVMHRFVGFSFPSRIAFKLSTECESRAVIDRDGAEKIQNSGEMLFSAGTMPTPIKVHGAFVSYFEVDRVTAYFKESITRKAEAGYKDDPIFLLSQEEYERYKNEIPSINTWWWLRSPSDFQNFAVGVDYDGTVISSGYLVFDGHNTVRPALNYTNLKSQIIKSSFFDDIFVFRDHPFRIIDPVNKIAIAEVPVAFDRFDPISNDYEISEIRRKLLEWFDKGVWEY